MNLHLLHLLHRQANSSLLQLPGQPLIKDCRHLRERLVFFLPEPGVPVAPPLPPLKSCRGLKRSPGAKEVEKAHWPCLIQSLLVHVQFSGPQAMQTEPRAWEVARFKESRTASGKAGLPGVEVGRQGPPSHSSQMAFPSTGQLEKFLIVTWEWIGFSGSSHELPAGLNVDFPCNGRVPQGGLRAPGCPLATVGGEFKHSLIPRPRVALRSCSRFLGPVCKMRNPFLKPGHDDSRPSLPPLSCP